MLILGTIVLTLLLTEPSRYFFNKLDPPIQNAWIYVLFPVVEWWVLLFLHIGHNSAFGIFFELAIVIFVSSIVVFIWSIITLKQGRDVFLKLRPVVCFGLFVLPLVLRYTYPPLYS